MEFYKPIFLLSEMPKNRDKLWTYYFNNEKKK